MSTRKVVMNPHTLLQVDTEGTLPPEFDELFSRVRLSGGKFEYYETEFVHNPRKRDLFCLIQGIPAELPPAFSEGGVPVKLVQVLTFALPDPLEAEAGVYYKNAPGGKVGPDTVKVVVDPTGRGHETLPSIGASGQHFDAVIAFFHEVLTGTVKPHSPLS